MVRKNYRDRNKITLNKLKLNKIFSFHTCCSLSQLYVQDPQILAAIQPWKQIFDVTSLQTVGVTKVPLHQPLCSRNECNLGNFVADAFVHYYITSFIGNESQWEDSIIGFTNSGGVRSTILAGRKLILRQIIRYFLDWNNW